MPAADKVVAGETVKSGADGMQLPETPLIQEDSPSSEASPNHGTLTAMEDGGRCRLLELPGELRNRVWEACLAPTSTLTLTASGNKRYATNPVLSPKLLCTCRQIYREAQELIYEQNRICFSIDAHDTQWPVVSEKRLPQHALEKLESVSIILDTATNFYSYYRNIDWTALTALISLKSLQLSIVWQRDVSSHAPADWMEYYDLLEEVLQRIPASTKITYGTTEGSAERALLESVVARRQQGRRGTEMQSFGIGTNPVTVQEFTAEEYAELTEVVGDVGRGSKSGGVEDVFADYHDSRMKMFSKMRVEFGSV